MLLKVDNMSVMYPDGTIALGGVSFTLSEQSILAVVGESGCGKTTMARAMLGLLPKGAIVRGAMRFSDKEIILDMPQYLERLRAVQIGLVMQDPTSSFNPVLSLGYHFHELLAVRGGIKNENQRKEKIFKVLEQVCLNPTEKLLKMYPHQFSGGQLQRLAIALALILKPAVLIADEPTSSLDVVVESGIVNLFKDLRRDLKLAIIFITHNLALAAALADNILVMHNGIVREAGSCLDIFNNPQDNYTKELLSAYRSIE
jgi:peptide/nickel transport system ATP-binding protein